MSEAKAIILIYAVSIAVSIAVSWLFKFIRDEIKDRRARKRAERAARERIESGDRIADREAIIADIGREKLYGRRDEETEHFEEVTGDARRRREERILVSAVRYALALRRHYTIEDTVGYVRDRLPELSDWCRRTIARAIEEQIRLFGEIPESVMGEDRFLGGGVQYQAMWEKLLEELSAVS